jgi:hypothetical protein
VKPEELRAAYANFFVKSNAGQYFTTELTRIIQTHYEQAEKAPETARDNLQSVCGIREVEKHIKSIITEVKK